MLELHPTAVAAVGELHARYPATPFLTLGQTALWDEPVKAAFCRILEELAPAALMVAAVHDTDYFAKLGWLEDRAEKFVLLPHNDGDTRGLWSAAGELSCLFGSETVPTRHALTENGVAFDRVARDYPGGVTALLNVETQAWGWRALVHTEPRPLIAADVKLRNIAPALRRQLQWGFGTSHESAPDGTAATAQISAWVEEFIAAEPDGTLSDLYRWLTPRLWVLVRGEGSCNLQTGASLRLFRFNRATAGLPRFRFLELFLRRDTRDLARRCYDDAVRGSGIYTLDQFGPGALPFDVVIPGRGRGTLRLHDGSLTIQTEEPITLCTGCDCACLSDLAGALEDRFGPEVAIVGKAVALISMLAHEFIFVFHEKASSYTVRTQTMNRKLREAGVALELHPLLRLKHAAWDALGATDATLRLPPHLAAAFGQEEIGTGDFAARWQGVCREQDEWRQALKACASPRELLALLARRQDGAWPAKLEEYAAARVVIHALRQRTRVLESEALAWREAASSARERAAAIERAKGDDFRATVQPLRERWFDLKEGAARRLAESGTPGPDGKSRKLSKEERAAITALAQQEEAEVAALRQTIIERQAQRRHFDEEIAAARHEARAAAQEARAKITARVALERSPEAAAARVAIRRIEYEAELARLRLVRDAITVSQGLRYTNYRPTAWWLPLVSPDGRWFNRLVQTAEARIEEL